MVYNAVFISLVLLIAAPAFPQKGFYRILGVEPDTRIFFDEAELKDAAGQYQPGRYTLRVEKRGHHTYLDKIAIYPDQLVEVRVRTMPAKVRSRPFRQRQDARLIPMVGTLVVTSDPPGKPVLLDSVARGTTPLVLENVPVGNRELIIDSTSRMINLRVFETIRVRLQSGKIEDVTNEELSPELREVELNGVSLFFTEREAEATDCSNFFESNGNSVFRLERSGMFLVCRMIFHLPKNERMTLPVRFAIYRGTDKVYTAEHELPIDPRTSRRVCYYHHEWWKPGEYVLTIDTTAGNRLGQVSFTLF
ncbi:PEGA domain-containing protein [candidate division KSB1 bacterium]|nr:PEGA domain-containing protein [candidate division KSB1 bacterium]